MSKILKSGNSRAAPDNQSPAWESNVEVRFKKLIENSHDGIALLNKHFEVVYRSESAKRINGWSDADHVRVKMDDLVHPDDKVLVRSVLKEAAGHPGTSKTVIFRALHFEGHYIWIESTYTNFLNDTEINAIVCNFRDISSRKRDEELLQHTLKELFAYQHALDESAIVAITDQKGIIKHVNDNFCKISKYSKEELIGQDHRIINSGYHSKTFIRDLWVTIANGKVWKGELKNKAKDGNYYWVDTTIVPFLNEQGKPYQYAAIRSDITEKKHSEEQLQQTIKELLAYKYALDESAIVAITDQKGIIKHVNGNFCRISKYAEAELIGQDHRIINSGFHSKAFIRNLWVTIANGEIWKGELKNRAKDGTYYWVDTTIVPFLNEQGKPYQYVAIRSDITERRQVQEKIIDNARFLKTVTDNLPAMIAYFDADQRCLFANKPYMEWFEKQPHEVFGANKRDILDREEFELHESHIREVLKGKLQRFERTFHKADGRAIDTDTQYLPDIEAGKVKGFFSLIYDITTVKLAEASGMKALEERNAILESIDDAFFAVDKNWVVTYWNNMAEKLFNRPKSEILNQNLLEKFSFWVGSESHLRYCDVIKTGRAARFEHKAIAFDMWLETSVYPAENGLTVYVKDVTGRKKAEALAIEALEERNTILESIDDAFFAIDKNWIITYWNNRSEKRFGMPILETVGRDFREIFPQVEYPLFYQQHEKAVTTNEAVRYERYNPDVNLWSDISLYPSENGGVSAFLKDITDRKEAEIASKESLEERNTILESIDDAFFAVDKNWVVTYWNNTAEGLTRTPASKILNHNMWEIFPDAIDSESFNKYHEAIETGKAVHFEDYYAPIEAWLEISAYPAKNGLSVYFKDITGRKTSEIRLRELNENLQKQAKELATSNAELEQFAYVASHDLQEPLRMVTSFLSQLEKKYSDVVDDKGRQYINFAVDGAKRMRQIILDLLDFSRVGRTEDDLEDVDINQLVNEMLALYHRQIEELQAQINFKKLPVVKTFKTPLRQVFQNLIGNSLKYHSRDTAPEISISCEETKTHLQFSVKDNGIGIASAYFDKIFVIFQRLHNKDEYSGTGMGLAIAKKIVENLGGKIWVRSAEGKGSTFYFTLLKK